MTFSQMVGSGWWFGKRPSTVSLMAVTWAPMRS